MLRPAATQPLTTAQHPGDFHYIYTMSLQVHPITFNPFEENTYFIIAPYNECIIIDPGCSAPSP